MKVRFLGLLWIFSVLLITSCGDSDPCDDVDCGPGTCLDGVCDCPDLSTTLVGTWQVSGGQIAGEVILHEDGNMTDVDCVLVEYENGGVKGTIKGWELNGMQITFTNMIDPALGSGSASVILDVSSFECNKVNANFGGFILVTFTRG